MADDEIATADEAENDVEKDVKYFDELRQAVGRTSPIALFGTSGLVVYQRIESIQDLELHKRLPGTDYRKYHSWVILLRFVTGLVPWLALIGAITVISSWANGLSLLGTFIEVTFWSIIFFIVAKAVQVAVWRLVSFYVIRRLTIRLWDGIRSTPKRTGSNPQSL